MIEGIIAAMLVLGVANVYMQQRAAIVKIAIENHEREMKERARAINSLGGFRCWQDWDGVEEDAVRPSKSSS